MVTTVPPPIEDAETVQREERRSEARKALRKFWIGGMAGAFFAAIARSIPLDWSTRSRHPELDYTLDTILRYGYMLWFTIYFFIATFNTDQEKAAAAKAHDKKDISFDMVQSLGALVAVTLLAAAADGTGQHDVAGFRSANVAILVIGLFSWILFPNDTSKNIQKMRACAVLLSGTALVLTRLLAEGVPLTSLLLLLLAGLCAVLWFYSWLRIDVSSSQMARAATGGPATNAPSAAAQPKPPPTVVSNVAVKPSAEKKTAVVPVPEPAEASPPPANPKP